MGSLYQEPFTGYPPKPQYFTPWEYIFLSLQGLAETIQRQQVHFPGAMGFVDYKSIKAENSPQLQPLGMFGLPWSRTPGIYTESGCASPASSSF